MTLFRRTQEITQRLGAGLITGAADDDPSGLATYSQAGAQFGGGLLWTLVLTTPLMIGIQMVSARIGWITGRGLAANIQKVMSKPVAMVLVLMLVFANTLNIAADIAAMGEALQLMVGGPEHGHAILFGLLCAVLPVFLNFESMVRVLKYLTLALLSYVAVALTLRVDWWQMSWDSVRHLQQGGPEFWMMVVGVLGTTISPYLFFWQASQEAEMKQRMGEHAQVLESPLFAREHLFRIKLDTSVGMLFSNLIAFCVMLSAAVVFNQHGLVDIQTTREAAVALEPIAGKMAFTLFALGIIGTGMLAVPVLAGSAAYAVADVFDWNAGLDHQFKEAKGFYWVLIVATLGGTLIDFTAIDPIRALLWSAVVNGVIAVPIMVVMMLLASNRKVLGEFTITRRHRVIGWIATAVMALAVLAMLWEGI
ncbi:MAG TPA: divalent metal cation transporter [Limnobacter sp.]|uniref:NRAMP family divalent metal transporter n=1 Tax=Limnobacter sp. TaxID=2003368 RepID=UPI002ED84BAE